MFLAHRSRMRKTTLERLAEDGRRTVLLWPVLPLDDALDSTIMGGSAQQENQGGGVQDKILHEPRRSAAEEAPEPVAKVPDEAQPHLMVRNWLEDALLRDEDLENCEEGQNLPGVEAEPRMTVPLVLPTEHPWVNRTSEEFWDELQDEVLMDTVSNFSNKVETKESRLCRP